LLVSKVVFWTLSTACIVYLLGVCSDWASFTAVPRWIVCKVRNRILWAFLNTSLWCFISKLFPTTCFYTFKIYFISIRVVNLHRAFCNTASGDIIGKVVNAVDDLTASHTFSKWLVGWMLKSIVSKRTYRDTSPCNIVLI